MDILYAACIAIIVLVQIVQLVGNNLAKIVDKK